MTSAVISFLLSILFSMGLNVTADNVGDTLGTIYQNQSPEVQQRMDFALHHPIMASEIGAIEFTLDMYNLYQENKATYVPLDVADESIGFNAFKNYLITEQDHLATPPESSATSFTVSLSDGTFAQLSYYAVGTVDINDNFVAVSSSNSERYIVLQCIKADGSHYYTYWWYFENFASDSSYGSKFKVYPNTEPFVNFSTCEDGRVRFDIVYVNEYGKDSSCTGYFPPYKINSYLGIGSDDFSITANTVTDTVPVGNVNGLDIAPDLSVTLPDGTKIYPNEDGTYTIDGNIYSPVFDISAYDDTALLNLLQLLLDGQSSSTTTPSTSANYSGVLGRILSAVNSLRSTFISTMSSIKSKVSDILSAVKDLPSNISSAISSDLAISDEVKNKAISDLKTKVGYSAIQSNVNIISTTFFGERTFNDKGEVVIAPVFDTGETITTQRPHLYFTLFNKRYDLFSGLYMFDGAVNTFKSVVSAFIICAFVLVVFRSLPSILVSCAEVVGISNPTVITNTFSNFNIYQKVNDNKPPKTVTAKAPKEGG